MHLYCSELTQALSNGLLTGLTALVAPESPASHAKLNQLGPLDLRGETDASRSKGILAAKCLSQVGWHHTQGRLQAAVKLSKRTGLGSHVKVDFFRKARKPSPGASLFADFEAAIFESTQHSRARRRVGLGKKQSVGRRIDILEVIASNLDASCLQRRSDFTGEPQSFVISPVREPDTNAASLEP